eukprot:2245061-Rhodomonas_salina.1
MKPKELCSYRSETERVRAKSTKEGGRGDSSRWCGSWWPNGPSCTHSMESAKCNHVRIATECGRSWTTG